MEKYSFRFKEALVYSLRRIRASHTFLSTAISTFGGESYPGMTVL